MSGKEPGDGGGPLYAAVLDAAAVGQGTNLLDLGCGAGSFARAAADRGARVTGIDTDGDAVRRAAAALPEGTFEVRDAADPPPGPFDVVAAVQLLMHVADPVAVLAAAARSGAVVVATVWGREQECDVRVLGEALEPWLDQPLPTPSPVTDPARLLELAERAGLRVGRLDEVAVPFDYANEGGLLGPLLASGLGRAVARRADPGTVRAAVLDRLSPYRTAAGGYRLTNLFRVLVACPASPALSA